MGDISVKKLIQTLLKGLDYLEETCIVLLFAFMAVMNFINVVSRYCFSNSFSFTEELTVMAFVWVTMLGVATGYKRCAHLGMSYLVEKFPKRGQAVFALFSMVCSLAMIVVLVWYGFLMVQGQIQLGAKTASLKLPMAMQGLSIPVGGLFIAVRTLQSGISEFIRLRAEGAHVEGGAAE